MEFSVVFDEKAVKELTNLPKDIKTRIFRKSLKARLILLDFLRD